MPLNYARRAAVKYRKSGLSVIPISISGDKRPYSALLPTSDGKASWSDFKTRLPTKSDMVEMFSTDAPMGVAIIGGEVSDGLEIIDIDDASTWKRYRGLVEKESPGLLNRIPQVISPRDGSGRHLYIFSESPGRCCALARNATGEKIIEVKGQGGYCLAPGSHTKCHQSGREYRLANGSPAIESKPQVTADERTILFSCAIVLDEYVGDEDHDEDWNGESPNQDPTRPGNVYMERETFATAGLLEKHGWTKLGKHGDRIAWARPDREDKPGFSALSGPDRHGRDRLVVFSSKGGRLKEGRSYNLFQCYTELECKGDYSRAALRLTKEGYRTQGGDEDEEPLAAQPLPDYPLLWRAFPLESLPVPASDFVLDVSRSLGCDPAFIAVPMLATLAGAVGNTRELLLRDRWTEPAVIWATILADSGSLKSPALDFATKHIRAIQSAAFKEYEQEKRTYLEDLKQYEDDLKQWRRSRGNGNGGRPVPPEKPICRRFVVTDITIEALAEKLQDNRRGVLLAIDELAGWILGMNQYKGGRGSDIQHWLGMNGARQLIVDRKGQEPIFVPRAAVSVTGPMPPAVFKKVMCQEHAENGMLARVLVALPPNSSKQWKVRKMNRAIDDKMRQVFTDLTELTGIEEENGWVSPQPITWSDDAEAVWGAWYDSHAKRQETADPLLRSAYAKIEAYAARMALVFHAVKSVQGATGEEIDVETVRHAVTIAEWFVHETERVYAGIRTSEQEAELLAVAEVVARRGGRITVSELTRSGPRFVRGKAEAAKKLLDQLVEKKWGSWRRKRPSTKGGRPTRVFKLAVRGYETSRIAGKTEVSVPYPGGNRKNGATESGDDIVEVLL